MPIYPKAKYAPELFEDWVVMPYGRPLIQEADWHEEDLRRKWGHLLTGTGNGEARLYRSTEVKYGGSGSCVMRTNSSSGAVTEVKITMPFFVEGVVAMEHRFYLDDGDADSEWDFGIESRHEDIVQARMKLIVLQDPMMEWQYEHPYHASNDQYLGFDDPLISPDPSNPNLRHAPNGLLGEPVLINEPVFQQAGHQLGWARLVADLDTRQYVRFQAASFGTYNSKYWDVDMTGIPMRDRDSANGSGRLLFFGLGTNGAATSQEFYTTDWCISQLYPPKGGI